MEKTKYKYRLFGRSKGRKKNFFKTNINIEKYKIDLNKDITESQYNILDVGSGSGENAIFLSKSYPEARIIASDIFVDGNINLINKILKRQ